MATSILVGSVALAAQIMTGQAMAAPALPSGGQVVVGQAAISTSGGKTVISQSSDKAIINWTDFSIGQGGEVDIHNGSGATLNRVTGQSLSSIDGLLNATGSVYLINPNGVIIGRSGVVQVGGDFVASALDLSNENFLGGGDLTFKGSSLASVVNLGKIGALGGDVALMAVNVQNSGTIDAAGGTAGLIAGRNIILRDTALNDGKFLVVTGGADTSLTNDGAIKVASAELRAEGGNIYALAGNTAGVIRATGVTATDGKVFLTAGTGAVKVSGSTIAASDAMGNGGAISVTGQTVDVAADATLDASATAANGSGGHIDAIADMTSGSLTFAGTALATGGTAGGLIETSGHTVNFDGAVINASSSGQSGQWLIDPYDLTVGSAAASTIASALANNDVTLQTSDTTTSGAGVQSVGEGDITIASDLSWSSAHTLTLDAWHGVNINANITLSGAGGLNLITNDGGTGGDYSSPQANRSSTPAPVAA
ncbi:filamentous hemagglutinin N-terminal domain-containing protein [Asticcacaulis sp. EMRT-3]|uniref:two-partner secretion domain-containing protein n=1 Tax=Asticcacaulis sp. EMRT-3 TaxID=3040349 RepID=UPI0024AEB61F|nr:filamentous hemagglutinin N-terminal domain-containing protein [Asticcacaulis sp. EMRT-3]MDI7776389.1 filamentous hemagglutinin N-terminal domain-containing protein [Asticcacaulis sp. EMRT-3]